MAWDAGGGTGGGLFGSLFSDYDAKKWAALGQAFGAAGAAVGQFAQPSPVPQSLGAAIGAGGAAFGSGLQQADLANQAALQQQKEDEYKNRAIAVQEAQVAQSMAKQAYEVDQMRQREAAFQQALQGDPTLAAMAQFDPQGAMEVYAKAELAKRMLPVELAKREASAEKGPAGGTALQRAGAQIAADQIKALGETASKARTGINALDQLDALLAKGVQTGAGQAGIVQARKIGQALGLPFEDVGDEEVFSALSNQLVLSTKPPGMGALSDKDMDTLKDVAPALSKTPEGNKMLVDLTRKVMQRNIEVYNRVSAAFNAAAESGAPSFDTASAIQQVYEQTPAFSEEDRQQLEQVREAARADKSGRPKTSGGVVRLESPIQIQELPSGTKFSIGGFSGSKRSDGVIQIIDDGLINSLPKGTRIEMNGRQGTVR